MESKADTLSEMVTKKWYEENWCARKHLEQYNPDKLENLMLSRIRKLSKEINEEHSREPMPIRTESFDEIFDSILNTGLLAPENPKVIGEQEKREAEAAAADATVKADLACELFFMQHNTNEIEEAARKNPYFKQWLDSAKYGSLEQPDAPTQQKNLFIVRGIRKDGVLIFVSSDTGATARSREDAFPLGRTRAESAAESLRKSGHAAVSILPV